MAAQRVLVACLCAAWCGSCRDYRPLFDQLAAQFEGQAEFAWVDVEDEADRLGDLDVENFPTLMIAIGDSLQFIGPVAPQLGTAARLVRSALDADADADAALIAAPNGTPADLPARIRALA